MRGVSEKTVDTFFENIGVEGRVGGQDDMDAWQEFDTIYEPLVFRIAISKGLQPADADDLVQEVMTRVAKSVGKWDPNSGKGSFRGWISTIARNLVIDFFKQNQRLHVQLGLRSWIFCIAR